MEQNRRHGRVLTVASDISSFQLAAYAVGEEEAFRDRAMDREDTVLDDGTSSIYSTCSTYNDTQTEEDGGEPISDDVHAAYLRLAFQNLCHVGLRIARLRHGRNQVQKDLTTTDETTARLGSELLLERLDLDDAAKADEIVDVLLLGTMEHPPPDVETPMESPMTTPVPPPLRSSRLLTLQQAASRAGRLRRNLAQLDVRLDTEERLVLWPGLEQWRLAVVEYRRQHHRKKQTEEERMDDPELLLQTVQRMLPRLDRQRLQRLWEHIGHALLSVPGASGRPEPVPAQLFI